MDDFPIKTSIGDFLLPCLISGGISMGTTAGADLDLGSEALCDFVESKVELEAGCLVSLELLPELFGNDLYLFKRF